MKHKLLVLVLYAIHANGVISGSFINNNIINCGNLICREISGTFTKDLPTEGYVHVVTIEAGASNISITEVQHSKNFLALRVPSENKYVFNGDYTISPSGMYEAGGAIFDYRRIDNFVNDRQSKTSESITEWITSAGPLLQPVELLVLGLSNNPGIKYEYLLPIASYADLEEIIDDSDSLPESERSKEIELKPNLRSITRYEKTSNVSNKYKNVKFSWKVVGFSLCSKSCGGGIRNPIIRCVRKASTKYYNKRRCLHSKKPVINESTLQCNTQPCPPYWRIENWSDCYCYDGEGFKKRDVTCVQELTMNIAIQVNDSACMEEKPISKKKCNCSKIPRQLSSPLRVQAYAKAPNTLIENNTNDERIAYSRSNLGKWLMSDWNQQCSTDCGYGVEYRSIFCDRLPSSNQICDVNLTPDFSRSCENNVNCNKAEWFVSSWKHCSGDCFNLTKSRSVVCIRNHLIVNNNECATNEKPESLQKCSMDEVEYCKSKWHYSLWSDCSKTCGGGTQKRTAKCLKYNLLQNTLKESTECLYSKREPIYRQCNPHECHN